MTNSEFFWNPVIDPCFLGDKPNNALEVIGGLTDVTTVITGIGVRAKDSNITTLRIEYAQIQSDGTLGDKMHENFGSKPDNKLERYVTTKRQNDVVVGFAIRVKDDDVSGLRIYTRTLDTDNGTLSERREDVTDGKDVFEIDWHIDTNITSSVMTRLGLRAKSDDVTTAFTTIGQLQVTENK